MALSSRPELAQSRIQLQQPAADHPGLEERPAAHPGRWWPTSSNSALAGQLNPLPAPAGTVHCNNPFFIGGYGTVLAQLFARNFPNYSVGFNLNIPIRNRAAQAQVINDELTYRQQQLALQRLENQVRVDVQNAVIGAYAGARAIPGRGQKARVLQAQTLDAEQKKLALGASTIYNVILDQQALTCRRIERGDGQGRLRQGARWSWTRSTGQILNNNNISLDEAFRGVVSRAAQPDSGRAAGTAAAAHS